MIEPASPFFAAIARLRARAWGQAVATSNLSQWIDEWDATAHHHCVYHGGQLAAAFRYTMHDAVSAVPHRQLYGDLIAHLPAPIAWSSRLVVDPDFRGLRLSAGLDRLAANEPFNHGANSIIATGGSVATNRFRHDVMLKLGWTLLGTATGTIDLPVGGAESPQIYARTLGKCE